MQIRVEIPPQVDQRRERALAEIRMRRRRHARDPHPGRAHRHLHVAVLALVALKGARLAHHPDVGPGMPGLDRVLHQMRAQPHPRVELLLDRQEVGAALLEDHVVVYDRHQASGSLPGLSLRRTPSRYALMKGSSSPSSTASVLPLSTPVRTSLTMR